MSSVVAVRRTILIRQAIQQYRFWYRQAMWTVDGFALAVIRAVGSVRDALYRMTCT
jgi:hypothetical protein